MYIYNQPGGFVTDTAQLREPITLAHDYGELTIRILALEPAEGFDKEIGVSGEVFGEIFARVTRFARSHAQNTTVRAIEHQVEKHGGEVNYGDPIRASETLEHSMLDTTLTASASCEVVRGIDPALLRMTMAKELLAPIEDFARDLLAKEAGDQINFDNSIHGREELPPVNRMLKLVQRVMRSAIYGSNMK
jgi:hypothetical protein